MRGRAMQNDSQSLLVNLYQTILKVILYSYLIVKKMNERITDS